MKQGGWWEVGALSTPFPATPWPHRTNLWRSPRSPRLSWRNTTRLYPFCSARPLRSAVHSPVLLFHLKLCLYHPVPISLPIPLLTPLLADAKSLHYLTQTPVLTLTCDKTMLLSKQFVQWDELLCQLEAAKQVKPAEE